MEGQRTVLLLEATKPGIRKSIVEWRRRAMQGDLTVVMKELDSAISKQREFSQSRETVALGLLKAELLHLDCREDEAEQVFDLVIIPSSEGLTLEEQFVIEQNHVDLKWARLSGVKEFYHLTDRRRLVGFELSDHSSVVFADGASARGKHREALSGYWRELVRTSRQDAWWPFRLAARRMASECVRIGELKDAVYYAVLAEDKEIAKTVANELLTRRDKERITSIVRDILCIANMQRHFCIGAKILSLIADAIPDAQVEEVAAWLLPRCEIPSDFRRADGTPHIAWDALGQIAYRLEVNSARNALSVATNHPQWTTTFENPNTIFHERKQIVEAVVTIVQALPSEDMDRLASVTLPLALERKQHHDYPAVVNLLCHIGECGGDRVKDQISDQLLVPGQTTFLTGQLAAQFGRSFVPAEQMSKTAEKVCRNIRLQVQRLQADQQAEEMPGNVGCYTSPLGNQKVVISIAQGVELETLVRHRKDLTDENIKQLVAAVLEMVSDRENFLSNRITLIRGLGGLADKLPAEKLDEVYTVLAPLAQGDVQEPTVIPTSAEAAQPLARNRVNMGSPAKVRGYALLALSRIKQAHPSAYRGEFPSLLEDALLDFDPEVRRMAYYSARFPAKLSASALMAILSGLRDQDSEAAASAFAALATKDGLHLTKNQWQLLACAARIAASSPSIVLRRTTAGALARLYDQDPAAATRSMIPQLLESLKQDICASVREAACYQSQ